MAQLQLGSCRSGKGNAFISCHDKCSPALATGLRIQGKGSPKSLPSIGYIFPLYFFLFFFLTASLCVILIRLGRTKEIDMGASLLSGPWKARLR